MERKNINEYFSKIKNKMAHYIHGTKYVAIKAE